MEAPDRPKETAEGFRVREFSVDRRVAAGILLLLFEAAPIYGLVVALQQRKPAWIAIALGFMAAGALPALGIWLRKNWAYVIGQYVSGVGLAAAVIRGLSEGFSTFHYVTGAVYAALFLAVNSFRPARPKAAERIEPDGLGPWAKENAEAIIIAFVMALVIRCFCIEVFKIPSSSMEPTLMGDDPRGTRGGDRIMVTKFAYEVGNPERFDVVVFKFPLNPAKNFIKRLVGLPNEDLKIREGNLYSRPRGSQEPFRIARKPLRVQDSIWIDPLERTEPSEPLKDFRWTVGPASGERHADPTTIDGVLSTREMNGERGIRFSLSAQGRAEGVSPDEARVAFDFELTTPQGEVFAEVVTQYGRFEARVTTQGDGALHFQGSGEERRIPVGYRPGMDEWHRLDLSVYDGIAVVRVNGDILAEHRFIETEKDLDELEKRLKTSFRADRSIAFGSRGATFRVRNLTAGRDLHYKGKQDKPTDLRDEEVVEIGPDQYLMMGDNVGNSHDSRLWVRRVYTLKDGRKVVCEAQAVDPVREGQRLRAKLERQFDLSESPDHVIEGDERGQEWALYNTEPEKGLTLRTGVGVIQDWKDEGAFRFIHRKYIVGKAFWIWWPEGRWFRLIR